MLAIEIPSFKKLLTQLLHPNIFSIPGLTVDDQLTSGGRSQAINYRKNLTHNFPDFVRWLLFVSFLFLSILPVIVVGHFYLDNAIPIPLFPIVLTKGLMYYWLNLAFWINRLRYYILLPIQPIRQCIAYKSIDKVLALFGKIW